MNRTARSGYKCQVGSKLRAITLETMAIRRRALALLSSLLALVAFATAASAKLPPPLRGPVATVGDRTVEAIDIENAAKALGLEPPHGETARAWRRLLLERCVDREILAAEAERRGLGDDPGVKRDVTERDYDLLMRLVYEKDLLP